MSELGFTKIAGAILAVALVILGLGTVSDALFGKAHGKHHAEDESKTINERLAENFSYYVEVTETGDAAGPGEVFDLGLVLANADVDAGAQTFRAKCSTCHTIEQGGANGTGPNLYNHVGKDIGTTAGFNYSNAMADWPGVWSYEELNEFIYNPKGHIAGTKMAFAGIRRDSERADVIMYLASYTPSPPAIPDPLPEPEVTEGEDGLEAGDPVDGEIAEGEVSEDVAAPTEALADAAEAINESPETPDDTPAEQ